MPSTTIIHRIIKLVEIPIHLYRFYLLFANIRHNNIQCILYITMIKLNTYEICFCKVI